MLEPYLNRVGGEIDNDVSTFDGGINSYVDKAFLESNQLPFSMNMSMYKPPMICTRPSRNTMAYQMPGAGWAYSIGKIIDMWVYDENQIYVIVEESATVRKVKELYRVAGQERFSSITTLEQIPIEKQYYFTLAPTANEKWLYITGSTFKLKISTSHNPLAPPTLSSDGHYGICCYHKGRLFLGNPTTNIVAISAAYDYDNFDEVQMYAYIPNATDNPAPDLTNANEDYIYLVDHDDVSYTQYQYDNNQWNELADKLPKSSIFIDPSTNVSIPDYSVLAGDMAITNAKGKLVAMTSFDDKLIFFCEHSMHCLYGDTPDQTKQNTYQLVDLNNNLGCHSSRCVTIGGGRLFWLGDNNEVYEYTGSSIHLISRPGKSRNETISVGGISNIFSSDTNIDLAGKAQMAATSERLYFLLGWASENQYMFVFDIYNRVWWCEDGEFTSITNYSSYTNTILMGMANGDILKNYENATVDGVDQVYDFDTDKVISKRIQYEFHTRVYGADGTDLAKSISKIWFQARADAAVYLNDIWTTHDKWQELLGNEQFWDIDKNYRLIGTLKYDQQQIQEQTRFEQYNPDTYEQQPCYVQKMYGQRLNTFQIIVKGTGASKFYLMKREWRAE